MPAASPEYQMLRTYIDWLLDVPWATTTEDRLDPVEARKVLDEDHYDLDKVKERIVEYLAVRKLKGDMKGPILCFVGPPVSARPRSASRSRGRWRGSSCASHSGAFATRPRSADIAARTSGRFPAASSRRSKQSGAMNPVFMLDEIDKVAAGFQGDPAAALLEVLDPAQNHSFRDHYLEVPVDLSKVLFIATANQLGTVHPRSSTGWRSSSSVAIARRRSCTSRARYLLPRQMGEHGLPPGAMEITDAALRLVISEYTREAGVRNLERQLGAIARKVAAKLATGSPVEPRPPCRSRPGRRLSRACPVQKEMAFRTSRPGVATGLAWTEAGGDVLFIEATLLPGGNQNIILTGQLGNVMQESARAPSVTFGPTPENSESRRISWRNTISTCTCPPARSRRTGRRPAVTMATAILSAARNTPVRQDVAMTGEITLSGLVLPVGGIREKSLAARRSGIKTVILPALNEPDLAELAEEIPSRHDVRASRNFGAGHQNRTLGQSARHHSTDRSLPDRPP
jgi:ATP-dependent Lon protease